jgi:hypothetical protein
MSKSYSASWKEGKPGQSSHDDAPLARSMRTGKTGEGGQVIWHWG